LASATALVLLALSVVRGNALGAVWCALAAVLPVWLLPAQWRRFRLDGRGTRESRTSDVYRVKAAGSPVGAAFPVSVAPLLGLGLGVAIHFGSQWLWQLYQRRLLSGELRRRFLARTPVQDID